MSFSHDWCHHYVSQTSVQMSWWRGGQWSGGHVWKGLNGCRHWGLYLEAPKHRLISIPRTSHSEPSHSHTQACNVIDSIMPCTACPGGALCSAVLPWQLLTLRSGGFLHGELCMYLYGKVQASLHSSCPCLIHFLLSLIQFQFDHLRSPLPRSPVNTRYLLISASRIPFSFQPSLSLFFTLCIFIGPEWWTWRYYRCVLLWLLPFNI